jgi:mono/diheme cytochrome c family protein
VAVVLAVGALAAVVFVHPAATAAAAAGAQQRTVFAGKSLFTTYCATCHGAMGRGDGPFAPSLRKRPPDLTQLAKQNGGTFPTERVTKVIDGRDAAPHGNSDMPVWGDAFSRTTIENDPESVREKIAALVKHVESLQERAASQ